MGFLYGSMLPGVLLLVRMSVKLHRAEALAVTQIHQRHVDTRDPHFRRWCNFHFSKMFGLWYEVFEDLKALRMNCFSTKHMTSEEKGRTYLLCDSLKRSS